MIKSNIIKGIIIILFNTIEETIIILPKVKEPTSPKKIFAGCEFKNKNPIILPITLIRKKAYRYELVLNAINKFGSNAINDNPASSPSSPSVKFEALLPPKNKNINKGKVNKPNFNPLIFKSFKISKLKPNKLIINKAIKDSKTNLKYGLNPSLFFFLIFFRSSINPTIPNNVNDKIEINIISSNSKIIL